MKISKFYADFKKFRIFINHFDRRQFYNFSEHEKITQILEYIIKKSYDLNKEIFINKKSMIFEKNIYYRDYFILYLDLIK